MDDQIVPEALTEWQQINSPPQSPPPEIDSDPFDLLTSFSDTEIPPPPPVEEERQLGRRLGEIGSEIVQAVCKVRDRLISSISGLKTKSGIAILISSAASGTVVLVLVCLLCVKLQRRRSKAKQIQSTEKFIVLIKEKDQKINQLMLQICQMNELLQAQRKVPVIRVG